MKRLHIYQLKSSCQKDCTVTNLDSSSNVVGAGLTADGLVNRDSVGHHPLVTDDTGIILTLVPTLKWLWPAASGTVSLHPLAIFEGEGDAGLKVTFAVVFNVPDKYCCRKAGVLKSEISFSNKFLSDDSTMSQLLEMEWVRGKGPGKECLLIYYMLIMSMCVIVTGTVYFTAHSISNILFNFKWFLFCWCFCINTLLCTLRQDTSNK